MDRSPIKSTSYQFIKISTRQKSQIRRRLMGLRSAYGGPKTWTANQRCPLSVMRNLHYFSQIFNQKRWYLRAKIKISKKFLTYFLKSSYENHESIFEYFFRIKSAGSSNYRGATFSPPAKNMPNTKIVLSESKWIDSLEFSIPL